MDIGRDMVTVITSDSPKSNPLSGPVITSHGNQKIPVLLTEGQMITGKYYGSKVLCYIGHRIDDVVLGNNPYMVPACQCKLTA